MLVVSSSIALILATTKTSAATVNTAINRQVNVSTSAVQNGWIQENGKWYYYVNGKKKHGWIHPDNWYYLNDDGGMQTV